MSQEYERLGAYLTIADRLIEQASKEDMAEVARGCHTPVMSRRRR